MLAECSSFVGILISSALISNSTVTISMSVC